MLNLLNNDQVAVAAAVSAHDLHRRYGDGDAAVDALRGVTLDVPSGRFVAVMGPSGSGKSTLMHLSRALTARRAARSRSAASTGGPDDDALTKLRRDRVGFIFQSFNLVPTLSTEENVVLPERLAGRKADAAWVDSVSSASASPSGAPTARRSSPAASSSASRSPAHSSARRPSCSPTSPPETWTRPPARRS